MRIAVISRMFRRSAGGAESYAVALVQEQAQRHEVHVFAQETDEPVPGVHYHRVICLGQKPRWVNQLVFAWATWRQTRAGFDVVHSHENTWHGQVQTIHVRPVRYNQFHGRRWLALQWRRLQVALSPRLLTYLWLEGSRFLYQPGRAVVATSDNLLRECLHSYPYAQALLTVVPPGTFLPPAAESKARWREGLDLPLESTLLLMVANDPARKGLDALLQALTRLPADVQLMVAGNTDQHARYRALTQKLGLSERVRFLGPVKDLSAVYRSADVLVHPTLEDSFAMVVLEAMAHRLPVVVSGPAHCGISSHLRDGMDALMVHNPQDAAELAQAIEKVLASTDLQQQLTANGLSFATRHSWQEASLQYERLYQQAREMA